MDMARFRERRKNIEERYRYLLKAGEISEADKIYEANKKYIDPKAYSRRRNVAIKKSSGKYIDEITKLIDLKNFNEAEKCCIKNKICITKDDYERLLDSIKLDKKENERSQKQKRQREMKAKAIMNLRSALNRTITEADAIFINQDFVSLTEYERMRNLKVKCFIKNNTKIPMNDEQIDAIATINSNVLLKARAGSGKTSVVTAKTYFLIQNENISHKEILLLAFNKKAATEMTERIRNKYNLTGFNNSRTFHSLAYQLAQPTQNLLFDESANSVSTQKQSQVIQKIIGQKLNSAFKKNIYKFFQSEIDEFTKIGEFLSKEDYLSFRRNLTHLTLGNQKVKSIGHKYIADFLFEHDIFYKYEKPYYWDNSIYCPNFSIYQKSTNKEFVIEYWEIDETDERQQISDDLILSWSEYRIEMLKKRQFWKDKKKKGSNPTFIEISVADLKKGRIEFEKTLLEKLIKAGIHVKKLSENKISTRICSIHITKLAEMFLSFIQMAKKKRMSHSELNDKINQIVNDGNIDVDNERMRAIVFLTMANQIYKAYLQYCQVENMIDFDDLMELAIKKIHTRKGNCIIGDVCDLNRLKWIMIDEYQDFSPLFHEMIKAIRQFNPEVKLFCVGDDWQAINSFAGSDLKFFYNAGKYITTIKHKNILTNYRSKKNIIDFANRVMEGKGEKSKASTTENGKIYIMHIDSVWIEQRTGIEYQNAYSRDLKFQKYEEFKNDICKLYARELKALYQILSQPANKNKTFAIISRTKHNRNIKTDIKNLFSQTEFYKTFDDHVTVTTIHKMKGLEADIVIILNVNECMLPLIHPNISLHRIFGVTVNKVYEEETRLFYVAITRAKEQLFFFTIKDNYSTFIRNIDGISVYQDLGHHCF